MADRTPYELASALAKFAEDGSIGVDRQALLVEAADALRASEYMIAVLRSPEAVKVAQRRAERQREPVEVVEVQRFGDAHPTYIEKVPHVAIAEPLHDGTVRCFICRLPVRPASGVAGWEHSPDTGGYNQVTEPKEDHGDTSQDSKDRPGPRSLDKPRR